MTENQRNRNAAAEDLFSRITEDVSGYAWACASVSHPPEGYDAADLLLLALALRARTRPALARALEAGPEYENYAARLSEMFAEADGELSRLRAEMGPSFAQTAGSALAAYARHLGGTLSRVSRESADADLFGADPGEFAEIRENAHLFVLGFSDLSRARQELQALGHKDAAGRDYAYLALEEEFSRNFGYFAPVRDLMETAREREYQGVPWFLARAPNPFQVPDQGLSPTRLEVYAEAFRQEADTAPRECPMAFQAIAVALFEADAATRKKALAHAESCRFCRRLILDIRSAAPALSDAPPPPAHVEQAIEAGLEERFPPAGPNTSSGLRRGAAAMALLLTVLVLAVLGVNALRKAETPAPPAIPSAPESRLPIPRAIAPLAQGVRKGALSISARRHRGMYLGGAVTGFSVFPVKEGGELRSGDEFRVHASVKPESYVYLFFEDSSGKISALASARLPAGQILTAPDRDAWFSLDNHPGEETVWLLAANRPILRFEARLDLLDAMGIGAIDKIFPDETKTRMAFSHLP